MMRKGNNIIKSFISFLLVFFFILTGSSVVVSATENGTEEISFNSIVEIEGYEIEGGYLQAGKNANILLTLRNANRVSAANNVMVMISSNSGMIYPEYGSDNQFYVGSLTAGSSTTITIPVTVNSKLEADYVDFICEIVYESSGRKITNKATMILPSDSVSSVAVRSVEVSSHSIVNGKSLLSINYSNNSTDSINDAKLIVDGNVSESTKVINLDYIGAGKTYTKDCNIVFTQPGIQQIEIRLQYTDQEGNVIENDLGVYTVTVEQQTATGAAQSDENAMLNLVGMAIAAIALIVSAGVVIVYIKKR